MTRLLMGTVIGQRTPLPVALAQRCSRSELCETWTAPALYFTTRAPTQTCNGGPSLAVQSELGCFSGSTNGSRRAPGKTMQRLERNLRTKHALSLSLSAEPDNRLQGGSLELAL